MAFQRNAQTADRSSYDLDHIAFGGLDFVDDCTPERHQALSWLGQLHRLAIAYDHAHSVMCLQRSELMGHRRLRKVHSIRSTRHGPCFVDGYQRAQMTDLEHEPPLGIYESFSF